MTIHTEHPFLPDPEDRDQTRRFRGRLAAPVTIVTSGSDDRRTGLTVSSLMLVEGEPPVVELVVSPNSDLWDLIEATRRFVVHICTDDDRSLADVFAGLRPNPGGVFAGSDVHESDWGPVLAKISDRAFCSLNRRTEQGYGGIVMGTVDRVEVTELGDPLVYFRGRYRRLDG